MPGTVRAAVADDLAAIEHIVRTAYAPWVRSIGVRPAPLDSDYAELISRGVVFVHGDDEPNGVIVLVPEEDVLLIENVAVRPDRQGEGIGRTLLAFAEVTALRGGRLAMRLFTHSEMAGNVGLYEALGYEVTGHEPLNRGHLVHLRKDLHPS